MDKRYVVVSCKQLQAIVHTAQTPAMISKVLACPQTQTPCSPTFLPSLKTHTMYKRHGTTQERERERINKALTSKVSVCACRFNDVLRTIHHGHHRLDWPISINWLPWIELPLGFAGSHSTFFLLGLNIKITFSSSKIESFYCQLLLAVCIFRFPIWDL